MSFDLEFDEFAISKTPIQIQEVAILSKDSPVRPPDWRWELVSLSINNPSLKKLFKTDIWLKKIYKFSKKLQEAASSDKLDSVFKLRELNPPLFDAWCINSRVSLRRLENELRARILAKEDPIQICLKTRIDQETLDYYVAAFFDVVDRLDSPSYILNCVIFRDYDKFALNSEKTILPFLGYFFGVEAVDYYAYRSDKKPFSEFLDDLDKNIKKQIGLRLWAAINSESGKAIGILQKLYSGLQLNERVSEAASQPTELQALVKKVLEFEFPK